MSRTAILVLRPRNVMDIRWRKHSELRGTLARWVSTSVQEYFPRRTKGARQLGGMIEGQQQLPASNIHSSLVATPPASCAHKYANCDAVIKLRRITQCVGQSQRRQAASESVPCSHDEVSVVQFFPVYLKTGVRPLANNIIPRAGESCQASRCST